MGAPAPESPGESTDADGSVENQTIANILATFRDNPLTQPLEFVGFWAAVALPFLYVPLLVETHLQTAAQTITFLALLAANVVALLVGHSYRQG